MLKRQDIINEIKNELDFLKQEEVDRLFKEKQVEEVEDITKDIQFTNLDEYLKYNGRLDIRLEEFGKEMIVLLVLYMNKSEILDEKILESPQIFFRKLEQKGFFTGKIIAKMRNKGLYDLTIEELMGLE